MKTINYMEEMDAADGIIDAIFCYNRFWQTPNF